MPQYVSFQRAINVGGRFLKMAALAEHFRALGHTDVQTFLNSGNVIFQSRARNAAQLGAKLELELEALLGFKSDAFVRTVNEVQTIAARAQALQESSPTAHEVNVCFLTDPLTVPQTAALMALQSANDQFVSVGREVYWICALKQSESGFSNALFERKLKARTTLRRVSMLQGLAARLLLK
jgi:uncharacterized protein (DUF1697 family)